MPDQPSLGREPVPLRGTGRESQASAARANRSLRVQLLGPLTWGWLVVALIAAWGAYRLAQFAGDTAYDQTLQDEAGAIATQVYWTDRGPLLELSVQAQQLLARDSADRNAYMVIDEMGQILAGSGNLPMPDNIEPSFDAPQLFDASYLGEPVRGAIYSIRSPMLDQVVSIVVVETRRRRRELEREIQLAVLLPTVALGLLTFGLLHWGIRRGVAPLRRVAATVEARDPRDLQPLPLQGVPAEAVPLIERINVLLANVDRAVRQQRRFVADAAHQLRTPVAGVRVLAQELQHEWRSGGEAAPGLLRELVASSERMGRLVSQLLNLARSESALRDGPAALESVDVVAVVREAAEPLALRASREGRAFDLQVPTQDCRARAHPVWLGEVVSNLLDNALRHGGSHVHLAVQVEPGGVGIEVCDDGPGIPADQRELVFEPFWRAERSDTRGSEGAGLGLAIVRDVVQAMGGRIELHSRPEFEGTRFRVWLPAAGRG
ncbi:MAG: sensor histidine kinase [Caldimonas sp.]|uniref:sensor histidine kinase n=1 Tax=Caldimonas sp. TaxID=2838790 RepID=UPI003918FD36